MRSYIIITTYCFLQDLIESNEVLMTKNLEITMRLRDN